MRDVSNTAAYLTVGAALVGPFTNMVWVTFTFASITVLLLVWVYVSAKP